MPSPARTAAQALEPLERRTHFAVSQVPVRLPDLSLIALTAPPTITPGSTLRVAATPAVAGINIVPPPNINFSATLVLSENNRLGDADDIALGSFPFFHVTRGTAPRIEHSFSIPADTPVGPYRLIARVDPTNDVDESDETNNVFLGSTVNVRSRGTSAILTAKNRRISLNQPDQPTATLTLTLANHTNEPLDRAFNVSYYVSADDTFSADDLPIHQDTIDLADFPLPANASRNFPVTVDVPRSTPRGRRVILAVIDADNGAPRLHTEAASNDIHFARPFLQARIRSAVPAPGLPTFTNLTIRLTNVGNAPTFPPTDTVTLGITSAANPRTVLGTVTKSPKLKPGRFIEFTVTVPGSRDEAFRVVLSQTGL